MLVKWGIALIVSSFAIIIITVLVVRKIRANKLNLKDNDQIDREGHFRIEVL
jgi:hypothetical protein